MSNNPITPLKYFSQQNTLCRKYLLAYDLKNGTEGLHRIRVSIKKIKAILIMLSHLDNKFDFDKTYAPYKNIFTHLGPIREYLLQRERMKKDAGKKQTKKKPRTIDAVLSRKLRKATPGYLKDVKEVLPAINTALEKLDPKAIYPYCHKLLKHVKSKWEHVDNDSGLHKYRKQLKQVLYCVKLLNQKQRDKVLSSKKFTLIDKLQNEIGLWHDDLVLLDRIKKDELKLSPQFIHSLKTETKELLKDVHKKGDKL